MQEPIMNSWLIRKKGSPPRDEAEDMTRNCLRSAKAGRVTRGVGCGIRHLYKSKGSASSAVNFLSSRRVGGGDLFCWSCTACLRDRLIDVG